MSLPEPWVDRIFSRLTLVYGTDFTRRWEGIEPDVVKADWARELSAYQQAPGAISYALENLPADKPPNVLQFKALCMRAPSTPMTPALSYTAGTPLGPDEAAQVLRRIREKLGIPRGMRGEMESES